MGLKFLEKQNNLLFLLMAGFFLTVYFILVYKYTINIPMVDDFSAIQDFLLNYVESSSGKEKVTLLFSQFGEHRILFARLIILMVYILTGGLNYSLFILIGNILMIFVGIFMYQTLSNDKFKGFCLLLLVLIFFNGQNFETSTWAMVGIANVGVLFVAMAAIYCMLSTRQNLYLCGLILSVITIFSNGNGMLIIPPVVIALYLQNRKKLMSVFLSVTLTFALLYFYNFESSRLDIRIIDLIKSIHILFRNFFVFIGLNVWIPSYKALSFTTGLFCVSVFLWGIWKKWHKKNLLLYAFLTFYYLSAAVVAVIWFKSEIEGALRYRIYCSPIPVLTFFLLINNVKNIRIKYIYVLSLLCMMFSLASTFLYTKKEQKRFEWKKKSAYNWHYKKTGLATFSSVHEEENLRKVEQYGWYHMPVYPLSEYASSITVSDPDLQNRTEAISCKIENMTEKDNYLLIEGWGYLENKSMNFSRIFVELTDRNHSYIVTTFAERRYDLHFNIPLDRIENCGFFAVVDKKLIPSGTYQIVIHIKKLFTPDICYKTKTEKFITISQV